MTENYDITEDTQRVWVPSPTNDRVLLYFDGAYSATVRFDDNDSAMAEVWAQTGVHACECGQNTPITGVVDSKPFFYRTNAKLWAEKRIAVLKSDDDITTNERI